MLQHKRRQAASENALSKASDEVSEPRHQPIEADFSLRIQTELYARLKEMRQRGQLKKSQFRDRDSAIAAAHARLQLLGSEAVFELYVGADGTGFFTGPLTQEFLRACLRSGHEGVAAILPTFESGVLLDVVLDDPVQGNFYEVEWW